MEENNFFIFNEKFIYFPHSLYIILNKIFFKILLFYNYNYKYYYGKYFPSKQIIFYQNKWTCKKKFSILCSNWITSEDMATAWLIDGAAGESMHAGRSATAANHEVSCGCSNDTFFYSWGLGCWLFLSKSNVGQFDVKNIGYGS